MKRTIVFGLACGLMLGTLSLAAPAFSSGNSDKKSKAADQEPVVWGMLSQNQGCVIFREYQKTKFRFYGVAETEKTSSLLDVIEGQNYTMQQKTWVEDQDGLNELQRIAVKDHITMVKIPDKYTDKQLDKARAACKQAAAPTPPPQ